ncbi:MAG: bifunctional DNA-binding transcriptional regulator/O6-methylguanine-DNA methyltransferase Ada [Anaerolineae bacterium]|jgi:AraC family transcriptional regulator of adaptative response/methylated-DNA-[protein]-cysteine methyltransferase
MQSERIERNKIMIDDERRWRAVCERDARFDGMFVYAVRSTGIYCRPTCPARRPRRDRVRFYRLPEAAERAGYRPCRRCHPREANSPDSVTGRIRAVCRYIEEHLDEPLTLAVLSRRFGVNAHHLQRTFTRLLGVSPREYAEACRMERIRNGLRRGQEIADTVYEAGYDSGSRLYLKAAGQLGMTPATYRKRGRGMDVLYTVVDSPLGQLLVAATEKGVCAVRLGVDEAALEEGFLNDFNAARIERDDVALAGWVGEILAHLEGREPHLRLPLDIRATAFQRQVWQALQEIPYGSTRTYAEIAAAIGRPNAVRAVGGACGANPVALLIPCHRVIQSGGGLGGYRWGVEIKRALLAREREQRDV